MSEAIEKAKYHALRAAQALEAVEAWIDFYQNPSPSRFKRAVRASKRAMPK